MPPSSPRLVLQHFACPSSSISWVRGVFDRPTHYVVQPDDVRIALYGPLAHQTMAADGTLALYKKNSEDFTYLLPPERGCAWEALGSDHNSGIAWFGPNEAMLSLMEHLETLILDKMARLVVNPAEDDNGDVPVWLSWSFNDGTRLLLLYTDIEINTLGATG